MKKRYILAIVLAAYLSTPSRAQSPTNGGFGPQRIIASSETNGATDVYAIDIDGDGDTDVLSASDNDHKIAWYENDGSGTFGTQRVIAIIPYEAKSVYATDLDRDGDPDVIVSSSKNYENTIAWYENDGKGNFREQQVAVTQFYSADKVYAADLDGDGDQDVLATFRNYDKVAWYENDGSGNFGTEQIITTQADNVRSVYAADLDGDDDLDVVISAGDFGWYQNDGQGNFTPRQTNPRWEDSVRDAYVADLDGDGNPDILSASSYSYSRNFIAWYPNDGWGNFGPSRTIALFKGANSIFAVDMDGDGDQDVLTTDISFKTNYQLDRVTWYENDGTGTFSLGQVITTQAKGVQTAYATDLDGDGDADVLSASPTDDMIAWYENDGQGGFGNIQPITGKNSPSGVSDTFAADLDGDGDQDILTALRGANKVAWYANDGAGNFGSRLAIDTAATNAGSVFAIDMDDDGDLDVIANSSDNYRVDVSWYENDGAGSFGAPQSVASFSIRRGNSGQIFATNLDSDGDPDILFTVYDMYLREVYRVKKTALGFSKPILIDDASGLEAADLDSDSDVDVLLTYQYGGIGWYENDGNANFKYNQSIDRNSGTGSIFITDLDGDGDQDVISPTASNGANYSSVRLAAWHANDGQGNFGPPQRIADPASLAYASDLDGDGDPDIILDTQWYENDGTGSFGEGQVIIDPKEGFLSRSTADLDGDGDPDVLSFSYLDDKIVWYENLLDASPVPNSIDLALINADTDQVLQPLLDGDTVDVATRSLTNFSVVASADTALDSVRFSLQGPVSQNRTERIAPYALFADEVGGTDFYGEAARPGRYTLTVEAFRPNGPVIRQTVRFRLQKPAIQSLALIRISDGMVVDTLQNGTAIDLDRFGTSGFSIQAIPTQAVDRIVLQLQGPIARRQVERQAPYALFGDQGDTFLGVPPLAGSYTLTATPFVRRSEDGKLAEGTRTQLSFQLVGNRSTAGLRVYPNRFSQELFVETKQPLEQWKVQLQSIHGQPQPVQVQQEEGRWRVTAPEVSSGHYVLQLISTKGTQTLHVVKEQ